MEGIQTAIQGSVRIANRFLLDEKLGEGSFGEVYAGQDTKTGEKVAIKLSKVDKSRNLQQEAKIYMRLNSDEERSFGVPHLRWSGSDGDYYFLVMDRLGPSLGDLLADSNRGHFSLSTICLLGIQGIYLLEYVHAFDLIHRDMKPNNFLMGKGKYRNSLYLIDFGLAKYYRDQTTNLHIPYASGKNLTGTARYVSINTHRGIEQSRRDDLESFGYVLIHLAKGRLPWQGVKHGDKIERNRLIGKHKVSTPLEVLCEGLPDEFIEYFEYCRNLEFEELPDYRYLRTLFVKVAKKRGIVINGYYDWS